MDNSLSKVNQISHLATKSVDEKKINFATEACGRLLILTVMIQMLDL